MPALSIGLWVLVVELVFMLVALLFTPGRVPNWVWAVWLAVGILLSVVA
jgi:hypothetical protein